jgi:hypothetical protein
LQLKLAVAHPTIQKDYHTKQENHRTLPKFDAFVQIEKLFRQFQNFRRNLNFHAADVEWRQARQAERLGFEGRTVIGRP